MTNAQSADVLTFPPPILYKYFSPDRIDTLETLELCFSRPSEFNDTFDTHYLVPKTQGAKGIAARFRFRNQLGIFCLTEKPDNHLMWVHYARNHTGFVLGFNARADFFRDDGRVLRKVAYEEGPRVLSEADLDVCFYKSSEWRYEQEWRCVRTFESTERRLVSIEPLLITQIIFGSQMPSWQIARIVQLATAYEMTHVEFRLSSPAKGSWKIENNPKSMSVCDACGGSGYLMADAHTIQE